MKRRDFSKMIGALAAGTLAAAPPPGPHGWKLGVITDEVSLDLAPVLNQFCPKYKLHWVELRYVNIAGKKTYVATEAPPEQARQLRKQINDAGLRVSVLDSPVYKIPLPGTTPEGMDANDLHPVEGEYSQQLEQLKRSASTAHLLGTDKVRLFSFRRVKDPTTIEDRVVEELTKAVQVAKQEGVRLVLENEFDCNVATGAEIQHVLTAVTDRALMLNWDPGNCSMEGEQPFPKAWNEFDHSRIGHIHLKDNKGKKWVPIGSGQIDFVGQFKALKQMHYQGTMSLETHYRNAANDLYASSVESMDGLSNVLDKV